MHVHFLDPYQERLSLLHRLDPRVKLLAALAFILTTSLTPPGTWAVYLLLLAGVVAAELLSDIPLGYYQKRALLALPFVLAALPLPFTVSGTPLWTGSLGAWSLTASQEGVVRLLSIAFKSWISLQAAVVLVSTTAFPDLLMALRALRLPRLLVAIIGLMWRYLFVMVDEALRLMRARTARSGESAQAGLRPGGSVLWRARVAGGMAGSLFLRSIERSDRIYMAMLARGYDGEVRSSAAPRVPGREWLILTVFFLLLVALLGLSFLLRAS